MIHVLREIGFEAKDLADVEYLSNTAVLAAIENAGHSLPLNHKTKEDVILYFRIWADLLEAQMVSETRSSRSKPVAELVAAE